MAWGDYDSDGDLDLLLAGNSSSGRITRVYRNDDLNFVEIPFNLPGVNDGAVAWVDVDKDGDLDLFFSGAGDNGRLTAIYRNDEGDFTDSNAGLTAVDKSAATWGDYDWQHRFRSPHPTLYQYQWPLCGHHPWSASGRKWRAGLG